MSPRVGNKHFSYSPKGVAAAKAASAKTGTPVTHAKPASAGSKTAPSSKANPMAAARSHGQQGAAMKAAHAAPKSLGGGTSAPSTVTGTSGKKVVVRPAGKTAKRR